MIKKMIIIIIKIIFLINQPLSSEISMYTTEEFNWFADEMFFFLLTSLVYCRR